MGKKDLAVRDGDEPVGALAVWLHSKYGASKVLGVGHRVVHGGVRFRWPTILNPQVLGELRQLIPLAPLDQPYNLAAIEAALTITSNVVYGKAPATLPIAGYRENR